MLYRQDPTLKIITTCGDGFANTDCRRCPSTTFTKSSVTVCNDQGYCDGSGTSRSTSAIGYVDGFNPKNTYQESVFAMAIKILVQMHKIKILSIKHAKLDGLDQHARIAYSHGILLLIVSPVHLGMHIQVWKIPIVAIVVQMDGLAMEIQHKSGCDFCPTLDIFKDEAEEIYARDNVSESVACSRKGTCTPPEAGASGANQTATCTCSPSSGFSGDDCSLCAPGFNAQGIMQCLQCPYQNDAQVDQSHVVHVVTWVQRVKTAHVENVGKIVMGKNIQIKRYLIPIHILIIQVKDFLH